MPLPKVGRLAAQKARKTPTIQSTSDIESSSKSPSITTRSIEQSSEVLDTVDHHTRSKDRRTSYVTSPEELVGNNTTGKNNDKDEIDDSIVIIDSSQSSQETKKILVLDNKSNRNKTPTSRNPTLKRSRDNANNSPSSSPSTKKSTRSRRGANNIANVVVEEPNNNNNHNDSEDESSTILDDSHIMTAARPPTPKLSKVNKGTNSGNTVFIDHTPPLFKKAQESQDLPSNSVSGNRGRLQLPLQFTIQTEEAAGTRSLGESDSSSYELDHSIEPISNGEGYNDLEADIFVRKRSRVSLAPPTSNAKRSSIQALKPPTVTTSEDIMNLPARTPSPFRNSRKETLNNDVRHEPNEDHHHHETQHTMASQTHDTLLSQDLNDDDGQPTDPNTFRILISTDNHLGYMEKDPVRCNDSFNAFEEVLQIAVREKVDFLLLGGDLFHESKPSQGCITRTLELFRKYCMGSRPCYIDVVSDEKLNFQNDFGVNYMDPNYNISLPVFSIHGNHDDLSGDLKLSALDILSTAGYLNYFGKHTQIDSIDVSPILLVKGSSKLALYGVGNIRDSKMMEIYEDRKITFMSPNEHADKWFNIFVIHQNRSSKSAHVAESFIPNFMDFVLWGHEHECRIHPEQIDDKKTFVIQPGSSVATSLCEAEANEKNIALVTVKGKDFNLEPIPLKSVRPFKMETVSLHQIGASTGRNVQDSDTVYNIICEHVEQMAKEAVEEWCLRFNEDINSEESKKIKPLIRLKIDNSGGYPRIQQHVIGQRFKLIVANPDSILLFYKSRTILSRSETERLARGLRPQGISLQLESLTSAEGLEAFKLDDVIMDFLKTRPLSILPENELTMATSIAIEKDDRDLLKTYVLGTIQTTRKEILNKIAEKTAMEEAASLFGDNQNAKMSTDNHNTQVDEERLDHDILTCAEQLRELRVNNLQQLMSEEQRRLAVNTQVTNLQQAFNAGRLDAVPQTINTTISRRSSTSTTSSIGNSSSGRGRGRGRGRN